MFGTERHPIFLLGLWGSTGAPFSILRRNITTLFEGYIFVFKNMLNAKLLPLQTRLRARALSERTRKGLLRSGHWGDPPPIRWQDVNPNPVHAKTCRVSVTRKIKMALTLPEDLVYVLPRVGGRTRVAPFPAALQPPVTNPPTLTLYPPAALAPTTLAESPPQQTGRAAPVPRGTTATARPAPTARHAAFVPGRLRAHSPGPSA